MIAIESLMFLLSFLLFAIGLGTALVGAQEHDDGFKGVGVIVAVLGLTLVIFATVMNTHYDDSVDRIKKDDKTICKLQHGVYTHNLCIIGKVVSH